MNAIQDLYQELIIDHGRHPRNFGELENPTACQCGDNPICGDQLTLCVQIADGVITEAKFEGQGCAISMASASLLTEAVRGMTVLDAQALFDRFHAVISEGQSDEALIDSLGKLAALQGVARYPARVKCATLSWHALATILAGKAGEAITTE